MKDTFFKRMESIICKSTLIKKLTLNHSFTTVGKKTTSMKVGYLIINNLVNVLGGYCFGIFNEFA